MLGITIFITLSLCLSGLADVNLEVKASGDYVTLTSLNFLSHEVIYAKGNFSFAYYKSDNTESIGFDANGLILARLELIGDYNAIGFRASYLLGNVTLLFNKINTTINAMIYAKGLSKLFSSFGYISYEKKGISFWRFSGINGFMLQANLTLYEPIIAGATPSDYCSFFP